MNSTQLRKIADEAYGQACAAPDDYARGYAAGVEDLARLLAGQDPSALSDRLHQIVAATRVKATIPAAAAVGARVIELGSAKGRGTIADLRTTVGIDMAAVQWDNATAGHVDWRPVADLTVMSGR